MTTSVQQSFMGKGEGFMGLYGGGRVRKVGQLKEFKIDITEETKDLPNTETGVGLADQLRWVSKFDLSMTFMSFSPENLAMAMWGESEDLAEDDVEAEEATAYNGGLLQFEVGVAPTDVVITVDPAETWSAGRLAAANALGVLLKPLTPNTHFYKCKTSGNGAPETEPTWKTDGTDTTDGSAVWTDMGTMVVASTDYQIKSSGVYILDTCTKISLAGTPVLLDYTYSDGVNIEALINTGFEYHVFFEGINFAREKKKISADLFRVKFSPIKDLALLGDDFQGLTLTGSVLLDDTKSGEGLSQFANIRLAN